MINNETCPDIYDIFDGKGWGEVPSGVPQFRELVLEKPVNGDLKQVLQEEYELRRLINSFRRKGNHVGLSGNGTRVTVIADKNRESLGNSVWRLEPFKPPKTK